MVRFSSVCDVVQRQRAGVAHRLGVLHSDRADKEKAGGEAGAIDRARNAQPRSGMLRGTNSHVRSRPHGVAKRQTDAPPRLAGRGDMANAVLSGWVNAELLSPRPRLTSRTGRVWRKMACGIQRGFVDMVKGRIAEIRPFSMDLRRF